MSSYTLEDLRTRGAPIAMAMLLRAVKSGEPFVTYGEIKKELEQQLNIPSIFTVQIGTVAGAMMDAILEVDPNAPLLNVMIARPNGIPSEGVSGYLATRYRNNELLDWDSVPIERKREIVLRERGKIFSYQRWNDIAEHLYGVVGQQLLPSVPGREHDYTSRGGFGGEAESPEHKRLKEWVSDNPKKIGIKTNPQNAKTEAQLLSGDEIDVLFSSGTSFHVVEVKSRRSNDADHKRGIYQCVKYREVKKAEHAPFDIDVQAILVTENDISSELVERAKILGIRWEKVLLP
ncbi:hypothetical protein [Hylemonella gracilis]|nr:hypothetical protein [Hylemonella gracilis]